MTEHLGSNVNIVGSFYLVISVISLGIFGILMGITYPINVGGLSQTSRDASLFGL